MSYIQMRTVPGLFVGRRTLLEAQSLTAEPATAEPGSTAFRCGACDSLVATAPQPEQLRDVVVKCACGQFNQL
jgi:hypothetical protein